MKNIYLSKNYRLFAQISKTAVAIMLCIVCLNACKKPEEPAGVAALNIFNGVVGSTTLVTNFNGTEPLVWYKGAHRLPYGFPGEETTITSWKNRFFSYSGNQKISFFEYPDTLAHSRPVTQVQLDLPVSSMNSLFLTGTIDAPDTLFTRDQPPYHSDTDSTAGIRVVNLVNGLTLSVNLQGKEEGSEVTSLAYKAVSPFVNYEVKNTPVEYVFEIRDKATGDLLSTKKINTQDRNLGYGITNLYRFRNFTLIVYGELNNTGAGALSSVVMNNN